MNRRRFLRYALLGAAGTVVGRLYAFAETPEAAAAAAAGAAGTAGEPDLSRFSWGFLVDTTRCIGCGACVRACKAENGVPPAYFRTWVEKYEIDHEGEAHVSSPEGAFRGFHDDALPRADVAKGFFVPKLCNHCYASACTQVCPVGASFESPDDVVLIDKTRCVGCGYCVQACPYGCRYVNHALGTADKCTLCYHRLHRGLSTACATACPRGARMVGNLKDPADPLRRALRERRFGVLKPELGTNPKCYYVGLEKEVV